MSGFIRERMDVFRIFFQHCYREMRDAALASVNQDDVLSVGLFQKLKSVCRESAAMCRTVEESFYLDKFNQHMMTHVPDFWRVVREYFEGDNGFHFSYDPELPYSSIFIYTGLSRGDLDFIYDYQIANDEDHELWPEDDDGVALFVPCIGGITKVVCIFWNSGRCGSIYSKLKTNITIYLSANNEEDFNKTLEMVYKYRKQILHVSVHNLSIMPVREPFAEIKEKLNFFNRRGGFCDRYVSMDTLYGIIGLG